MDYFATTPVTVKRSTLLPLETVTSPTVTTAVLDYSLATEPVTVRRLTFPPLETVTSPTVNTAAAAYYLNRQPQTLRWWSSLENGPLRPIRVSGRLAWPTADIKKLMGVAA